MGQGNYLIGDLITLRAAFQDHHGTPADPSRVSVQIKYPDKTIKSFAYGTDDELKKESTGIYYIDIIPNRAGVWRYRWAVAGTVTKVAEAYFLVEKSAFC